MIKTSRCVNEFTGVRTGKAQRACRKYHGRCLWLADAHRELAGITTPEPRQLVIQRGRELGAAD